MRYIFMYTSIHATEITKVKNQHIVSYRLMYL